MAYTKTNWSNDTAPAINEENLNKIENGIFEAHNKNEEQDNKINSINSYSEQETIIGSYLGKTLYRKVFTYETTAQSTYIPNSYLGANIEHVDIAKASAKLLNKTVWDNNYNDGTDYFRIFYNPNTNGIQIRKSGSYSTFVEVTLEYTKTTD